MHVQARASTTGSAFPDDDDDNDSAISATYPAGRVLGILELLAEQGFNLRSAGGGQNRARRRVRVRGRCARRRRRPRGRHAGGGRLRSTDAGIDAHVVEVQVRYLADEPGALRDFVRDVSSQGLLIEEIAVGTPEDGQIPVQIYTVKAGG